MDLYTERGGPYKRTIELKLSGSITIITLNSLVLLGCIIQAIHHRRIAPYLLIFITSASFIAQDTTRFLSDRQATPRSGESLPGSSVGVISFSVAAASDALALISMILIWIYLLDIFRFSMKKPHSREKLYGTYFGYLWAVVGIVCVIAFASNIHYSMDADQVIYLPEVDEHGGLFAAHGVWGFCIFLAYEFHFCKDDIKPFRRTLAVFASFVLLSTVGSSVSAYLTALEYPDEQADAAEKSFLIETNDFVLDRLPSALGLIWAALFAHTWDAGAATHQRKDSKEQPKSSHHMAELSSGVCYQHRY